MPESSPLGTDVLAAESAGLLCGAFFSGDFSCLALLRPRCSVWTGASRIAGHDILWDTVVAGVSRVAARSPIGARLSVASLVAESHRPRA